MNNFLLPVVAVSVVGLSFFPLSAKAFTISSNHNVNGGTVVLQGSGESIVPFTGPVYDWSDNNGDGNTNSAGDDATANLNLGSYKIFSYYVGSTPSASITLKLRTSAGKGSITGNSGVTNLTTSWPASGGKNPPSSGSIAIYGAADISMGGIDSSRQMESTSSPAGGSGHITIGQSTDPVGNIRVDFLRTTVPVFSGPMGSPGNLAIYGSHDVLVQTSGGTAGYITTWNTGYESGRIGIYHDGGFRCAEIRATAGSGYTSGGRSRSITLNGDFFADGISGECEILGGILAAQTRASYGANNEGITITGYTNVSIGGDVLCYNISAYAAGNLLISNVTSDITIGGEINLNAASTDTKDGSLTLYTSGGSIYVGRLDMGNVKSARFSAGLRRSWITGVLTNFTGESDSRLRLPPDQKLYYDPELNPVLSNMTYRLHDWSGTPSAGGELRPIPIPGTVVIFK